VVETKKQVAPNTVNLSPRPITKCCHSANLTAYVVVVVVVVVVEMNIIKVALSHFCCRTTVDHMYPAKSPECEYAQAG